MTQGRDSGFGSASRRGRRPAAVASQDRTDLAALTLGPRPATASLSLTMAAGGGLTAAATAGWLWRLRWPGKRLEGTAWPAVVTEATLLHTAEEEERERSASSSGISPGSAMALAGSEAEKRGRGRMENTGSKGSGSASKTRASASWRACSERGVERSEPREPRGVETLCDRTLLLLLRLI